MSEVKKDRGRPSTKYNENELWAIISHYRDNVKPQGDIKYLQLYKYHIQLNKENPDICSRIYSEDFWRKKGQPGREIIDMANQIRTVTLVDSKNKKRDIPNVVDVVHKYSNEPQRLIKHLRPLENEVRRSIEKERELMQKNENLIKQIKQDKEAKKKLREQIAHLSECIFKLFHYSDKEGTPLENLLDINNKNKRIKRALNEAFSKPHDFYTELDNFQQRKNNEVTRKDKIVNFTTQKDISKRTLADDFEDRF